MNEPLPGQEKEKVVSEIAAEEEGNAFMAAMAQHQALTAGKN